MVTGAQMWSARKSALTVAVAVTFLLVTRCCANQYDPHLYPKDGPFFEGWYVRLVDIGQNVSLGFLFGRVLPTDESLVSETEKSAIDANNLYFPTQSQLGSLNNNGKYPLVVAGILVQDRNISQKLQSFTTAFSVDEYSVKVKGKPVKHDPNDRSPSNFSVVFGNKGFFSVIDGHTLIDLSVGNVRLTVEASKPLPWGPDGEGPEGWLEHLPLPLHWFVYSLQSTVTLYKFTDNVSSRTLSGRNAYLHMEKNWGKSFPAAWVWSQVVTEANVTLALSGGIVDFDVVNVTAFLVGFRNPAKGISWNFTPANSIASFLHDGCQGYFNLNLTGFSHKLALRAVSPVDSFSECLLGPEGEGFRSNCVESYNAIIDIKTYEYKNFHFMETDRLEIHRAALEFGGKYVCKDKCSNG